MLLSVSVLKDADNEAGNLGTHEIAQRLFDKINCKPFHKFF
jgi:hypothetical protein